MQSISPSICDPDFSSLKRDTEALNLLQMWDVEGRFEYLVNKILECTVEGRLLIHVDEHRHMCNNPAVRRGALMLLSSLPEQVRVIATFTDIPPLPSPNSPAVCRVPISKPIIDVGELMKRRAELSLLGEPKNKFEKRLLAALKVNLGLARDLGFFRSP